VIELLDPSIITDKYGNKPQSETFIVEIPEYTFNDNTSQKISASGSATTIVMMAVLAANLVLSAILYLLILLIHS